MSAFMEKINEKKNLFLGILLAASAVTAWGSQSVVCRYIYGNEPGTFDAATLAFYRFFIGGIVLLIFQLFRKEERKKLFIVLKKGWYIFLVLGFIGITLEGFCQTLSLKYTTAGRSALFGASAPVFTVIFATLFLKEKLNKWNISGTLLGVAGVVLVLFKPGMDTFGSGSMILGDILALCSGLSWGLYTVIAVKPTDEYGAITCTAFSMLFASVFLFIPAAWTGDIWQKMPETTFWGTLYLGTVAAGFAIPAWVGATKYLPAGVLGAFGYLSLVLAILFSILFLGEKFSWQFAASFFMTLSSLYLVIKGSEKKDPDSGK